jgi:type IV pilus assembly protein PilB
MDYKEPNQEIIELMEDFEEYAGNTFYRGKGCRYCHQTGYSGRTGLCEVMVFTEAIKQMVLDRESPLVIKKKAMDEGMLTLRRAGWEKVLSGVTTIEELNRVTFED